MAERYADQEFVEYVVKSIVDHPDDVKVERTIDELGVLITLSVNPEDMGQTIGRQGMTAKSIRTLLRTIGAKNDARVNLKILEPEGGRGPRGGSRDDRDDRRPSRSRDDRDDRDRNDPADRGDNDQPSATAPSKEDEAQDMPKADTDSNPIDDLKI